MTRLHRPLKQIALSMALCGLITAQAPQSTSQRTTEEQQGYRQAMEVADQNIADEVKAHSELMKNLEYLTTQIGPRLTGSPQMQAASDWTLKAVSRLRRGGASRDSHHSARLDTRGRDRRNYQPDSAAHRDSRAGLE